MSVTSVEVRETALERWRGTHGRQCDELFDEVYSTELRQELLSAPSQAHRNVICAKAFQDPHVLQRAKGAREMMRKKAALKEHFVTAGGSAGQFEKEWPAMRMEILRKEVEEDISAKREAQRRYYRRTF